MSVCQDLGGDSEWRMPGNGSKVPFGVEKGVLKLDSGNGCAKWQKCS